MNILHGNDFDSLRRKAINMLSAKDLQISAKRNKKYVVTLKSGDQIHFGHPDYENFMIHRDHKRRFRYRKRASEVRDKHGNLTYKDRNSPNYWSYHLLWQNYISNYMDQTKRKNNRLWFCHVCAMHKYKLSSKRKHLQSKKRKEKAEFVSMMMKKQKENEECFSMMMKKIWENLNKPNAKRAPSATDEMNEIIKSITSNI